jgi:hypothetical protein
MCNTSENITETKSKRFSFDISLLNDDFLILYFQDVEYLKLLHQQQIEINDLKTKHKEQKEVLAKSYLESNYYLSSYEIHS